ncbi:MAG: metal ABC transporter permease [Solirubrobacteraceae bacterium]|nr:metal ABC transporter permease [Solirubrobacteraceae bacterium]
MIDWLVEPLRSTVVARALAELLLLGVVSGSLGSWIVLWRLSYSAESLAHGMLPGLVIAALAGVPLVIGGAAGLLVATLAIAAVGRVPRLGSDVAVSVVITTLLGLGVLLGLAPETPAGLDGILFGDVLGVSDGDLALTAAIVTVVLISLALLRPSLVVVGLDRLNAAALGRRPGPVDVALGLLLALATLVAVEDLGNLLVVAMLVGPAAAARLVTRRLTSMMLAATAIAGGASLVGIYASYHARLAAGASVTCALALAYVAALAARRLTAARRAASRA